MIQGRIGRKAAVLLAVLIAFGMILGGFPAAVRADGADKTALTAAINAEFSDGEARTTYALTQADYTEGSWSAYTNAISDAIAVEGDAEATQQQVDDATNAIASNRDALVFAGQAALDAAIADAGGKVEEHYTPESWAGFVAARDAAYALPETTNDEVVAKTGAVNDAIGLLVPKEVTVTFDSRGGSDVGEQTALCGSLIEKPSPDPTRTGYGFAGWYKDSGCTDEWDFDSDTVTPGIILYAKWTPLKYTVSAKVNSSSYGSVSGAGKYDYGTRATLKAVPKAGYRFVRWLEGSKQITTNYQYSFTVTKSRTLKAEFAKIGTPSITYCRSSGYDSVTLKWSAVTGAKGYSVYRATSKGGTYKMIASVTSRSYKSTGLTTNRTYYYRVRARCTAGTRTTYGSLSSYKYAKPLLSTPSGVKASSASYNSVKVSWTAVAGRTKYQVYRATSSKGSYKKVAEFSGTSYRNSRLTPGKSYYYKVRAYRVVGKTKVYGSFSKVVGARPVPSKPTGASAKTGPKCVYLKWSAVSGATGYAIYRSTSSAGTYKKITSTSGRSYTNKGLTVGKKYYYRIRAYRKVGSSNVYGSLCSAVYAVPRKVLKPDFFTVSDPNSDSSTSYVVFILGNVGSKTLRVYNSGCRLVDASASKHNRSLQLINLSDENISYNDVAPGYWDYICFRVKGDPTRYNTRTKIYYEFTYDTIRYKACSSEYYGLHYTEK